MLENVEHAVFHSESITLDGKFFIDCMFFDCELLYDGTAVQWKDCGFQGCKFTLTGRANWVVRVLRAFNFTITPPERPQAPAREFLN